MTSFQLPQFLGRSTRSVAKQPTTTGPDLASEPGPSDTGQAFSDVLGSISPRFGQTQPTPKLSLPTPQGQPFAASLRSRLKQRTSSAARPATPPVARPAFSPPERQLRPTLDTAPSRPASLHRPASDAAQPKTVAAPDTPDAPEEEDPARPDSSVVASTSEDNQEPGDDTNDVATDQPSDPTIETEGLPVAETLAEVETGAVAEITSLVSATEGEEPTETIEEVADPNGHTHAQVLAVVTEPAPTAQTDESGADGENVVAEAVVSVEGEVAPLSGQFGHEEPTSEGHNLPETADPGDDPATTPDEPTPEPVTDVEGPAPETVDTAASAPATDNPAATAAPERPVATRAETSASNPAASSVDTIAGPRPSVSEPRSAATPGTAQGAAAAEGADATDPLWRQVRRALGAIRSNADGEQVFTIRLRPAELGALTVRIHTSDAGVRVSLVTDTAAAANQLSQQRQELVSDLEERGLSGAGVDVSTSDQGAQQGSEADDETSSRSPGSTTHGGPTIEEQEAAPSLQTLQERAATHRSNSINLSL